MVWDWVAGDTDRFGSLTRFCSRSKAVSSSRFLTRSSSSSCTSTNHALVKMILEKSVFMTMSLHSAPPGSFTKLISALAISGINFTNNRCMKVVPFPCSTHSTCAHDTRIFTCLGLPQIIIMNTPPKKSSIEFARGYEYPCCSGVR